MKAKAITNKVGIPREDKIMYGIIYAVMVILLVIIVQVFQECGMRISKKTDRRL